MWKAGSCQLPSHSKTKPFPLTRDEVRVGVGGGQGSENEGLRGFLYFSFL